MSEDPRILDILTTDKIIKCHNCSSELRYVNTQSNVQGIKEIGKPDTLDPRAFEPEVHYYCPVCNAVIKSDIVYCHDPSREPELYRVTEIVAGKMYYYYDIKAQSKEDALIVFKNTYPSDNGSEFFPEENGCGNRTEAEKKGENT